MPPLLAGLPGTIALGKKIAGRLKKPSARYGGKTGPLMGTVTSYLLDIAKGGARGAERLREMWTLRGRDGAHRGWGLVWDNEVRALAGALTDSIEELARELDDGWPRVVSESAPSSAGGKTTVEMPADEPTPEPKLPPPAPVARKKRKTTPRAPKVKKVKRYNPDTGRQVSVDADSFEAAEWPSRKPARKKLPRAVSTAASRAGGALASGTVSAIARGAKKLKDSPTAMKLVRSGVAIGGLSAGYWIGTKLNRYLAGRALAREEAGVQAALAFREARADAAAAKGAKLTAAETRSMGDVYKAQLVAMGYDPKTFTKKRGLIARWFTGQEET